MFFVVYFGVTLLGGVFLRELFNGTEGVGIIMLGHRWGGDVVQGVRFYDDGFIRVEIHEGQGGAKVGF